MIFDTETGDCLVPHVDKFMRATVCFCFVSKAIKVIKHFGRRPYARVPEYQDPFACCVFQKSKLKFGGFSSSLQSAKFSSWFLDRKASQGTLGTPLSMIRSKITHYYHLRNYYMGE